MNCIAYDIETCPNVMLDSVNRSFLNFQFFWALVTENSVGKLIHMNLLVIFFMGELPIESS